MDCLGAVLNNVTGIVGGLCNGRQSCTVAVNSSVFNITSILPGLGFLGWLACNVPLSVNYTCNGAAKTATAPEGGTASLSCP